MNKRNKDIVLNKQTNYGAVLEKFDFDKIMTVKYASMILVPYCRAH